MRYLYTLDELAQIETNGWSCNSCGAAWLTIADGLHVPFVETLDRQCRHPVLTRALLTEGAA